MAWAILVWQPMASSVTRAPASAKRSRSSGMAAISFDLALMASCPSTRRWRAAQAETRCNGSRPLARLWVRRDVLPSMATRSGSVARRPSTQVTKQVLKSAGSSALMTSLRVSWEGRPSLNGKNRRRKSRFFTPPEPDFDEVLRARQRCAEHKQHDLRQRIDDLPDLARVLEGREVFDQGPLCRFARHGQPRSSQGGS